MLICIRSNKSTFIVLYALWLLLENTFISAMRISLPDGAGINPELNQQLHYIFAQYMTDTIKENLLEHLGIRQFPSKDVIKRVPKDLTPLIGGGESSSSSSQNDDGNRTDDDQSKGGDQHSKRRTSSSTDPLLTSVDKISLSNLTQHRISLNRKYSNGKKSSSSSYRYSYSSYSNQNATFLTKVDHVQKFLTGSSNTPDMRFPVDPMRTYFHLVNMSELDVRNATLHILIKKPPDIVSTGDADPVEEYYEYDVHVYRYINETRIDSEPVIKKLLKKNRSSSFNDDAGVQVDVTGLVKAWVKSPRKNFGVLIKVRDQNDEDVTNRTMNDSNDSSNIFLSIEFNPDAHKRVSYEPYEDPICTVDQHEDRCCRYPLQVDFEAMGWDWIIAPKRYDAFYCAGLCPFRYKQSSPHTHLTQQIESLLPANHRYRSVGPCCSPHEYQDLKILYVTQAGTIHERRVPDMMVVRCGCA